MTTLTNPSYPKPFIPEGLCQCGCGGETKISKYTDVCSGYLRGKPRKFMRGHQNMKCWIPSKVVPQKYPYGECQCGCGGKTNISKHTSRAEGWFKGKPIPFIFGHSKFKSPHEYLEEDSGWPTPCWIWQRALTQGYGRLFHNGSTYPLPAHRVVYERHKGPIPKGLHLDHLCRVRPCVNPDHLEPVTCAENVRRGLIAKLSVPEVKVMRSLRNKGWTYAALGKLFHVTGETCRTACNGDNWKGID